MIGSNVILDLEKNHPGEYSLWGRLREGLYYGPIYCYCCEHEVQGHRSSDVEKHFASKSHTKACLSWKAKQAELQKKRELNPDTFNDEVDEIQV